MSTPRMYLYLIAILFSTIFTSGLRAEVIEVDNSTLQSLLDQKIPVIDVRRVEEWVDTGVVENSHLLTFFNSKGGYDAEKWLKDLEGLITANEPVILICRSGHRTGMISQWLSEKQGYARVYNVSNGILGWKREQGKTVKP